MNRRGFLSLLAGAVPVLLAGPKLLVDVSELVWTPEPVPATVPTADLQAITAHIVSQVRRIYGPLINAPGFHGDGPIRHQFGVDVGWYQDRPLPLEYFDFLAEQLAGKLREHGVRYGAPPPLPTGFSDLAWASLDGVSVRGIREYYHVDDVLLTRFDMVVG